MTHGPVGRVLVGLLAVIGTACAGNDLSGRGAPEEVPPGSRVTASIAKPGHPPNSAVISSYAMALLGDGPRRSPWLTHPRLSPLESRNSPKNPKKAAAFFAKDAP